MSRVWPLLALALLLVGGLAAVPSAHAAHEWGHRFMIVGRILDADGAPAQLIPVTVSIESTQRPYDPQLTVQTDCTGFYYSLKQQPTAVDHSYDAAGGGGYRMHIHRPEYDLDARYIVATPYAEYHEDPLTMSGPLTRDQILEYSIHTARADRDAQHALANIRLDRALEPNEQCEDIPSWQNSHVVVGKVQREDGRNREEATFANQPVNVTIQTEDGPRSRTVLVDITAMYIAYFENVTVANNARITVEFDGNDYRGTANTEYGVTRVTVLDREPIIGSGAWVFFGLIGVAVLAGAGWWGYMRVKDRMEVEKARQHSTRKRANR
jgi:hypothetical protein